MTHAAVPPAKPPLIAADGSPLRTRLKRAERAHKLKAVGLLTPLAAFLLVVFVLPIATLLYRAVDNPELVQAWPRTVEALAAWEGEGVPPEPVFAALAADLAESYARQTIGGPAKRLNYEISGFRSQVMKVGRRADRLEPPYKETLIALDPAWGDPARWAAIRRAAAPITGFYLLSALDLKVNDAGEIVAAPPNESLYRVIFARTFWMSLVVTVFCLLLGYPLAYWLATLPARISNLLMILVLLPFWTSLLVRTAAWIVLLQQEGPVNNALMALRLVDAPLQLVFNRFGVYVAMVHILLPFLILPVYSVMKGIPPSYLRAAVSLGAHPFLAFWRVYVPLTLPGVGAGCLLVYILAIGYYITPALIGGPQDQMVSYFVAFFTNNTINWGMAAALGSILLLCTLVLYLVYARVVGADRMKLG